MALRFAILGSLAKAPASGYDLLRRFDRKLNFVWWASHGAVYTELQRLEREGLLVQQEAGSRRRLEHSVTPAGLVALRDWLRTEPLRRPRDELVLRIWSLWLLEPADGAAFLDQLADGYRERLALYEERAAGMDLDSDDPAVFCDGLALQAGLAHERAMLAWAEESAARLRRR